MNIHKISSPSYVIKEDLLRKNLAIIQDVKKRADVEIILALKSFAIWKTFPIIREYIQYGTASSIHEARLVYEELGSLAHTYSPAFTDRDFPLILKYSSHITFNSLAQFERFYLPVLQAGNRVSCGLRINPECSLVETTHYNPCTPGSRLGVTIDKIGNLLPQGIDGLHFHALCESSSYDLEKLIQVVEAKFGHLFAQIKWLNMGGGHLITRQGYDIEHLITLLQSFRRKYPHLKIILEPGSAFTWQTGFLLTTVVDVVENDGIKTAIIDTSFTCHTPDCLEMPYKPIIRNATDAVAGKPTYRIGGCSCLSGDFIGEWSFDKPLKVGDKLVFEDMIHYTVVKTTMFNGISHPSIVLWTLSDEIVNYRNFTFEDYKSRMC